MRDGDVDRRVSSAARPLDDSPPPPDAVALAPELGAACARARRQVPWLAFDDGALSAVLLARTPAHGDPRAYVETAHAGDLALALAAADGEPRAIAEIHRRCEPAWRALAARFVGTGHSTEDLVQILRVRLFVGDDGGPPRIGDYGGHGFLENWLRVVAIRTFVDLRRRKDRARERPASEERLMAMAMEDDPALSLVKAELRGAVAAAMRAAALALPAGDRHLLRQHLVVGQSIDRLGAALGIHRATAARRVARAREELAQETRRRLAAALALPDEDLADLLDLVTSRLEMSLATLLATAP